mmetsp:Transcript_27010/g.65629  ORF Transcript_27010/g.65629 Transcript_27010/m.65629 type:complete len:236 (-) Transcript_27010:1063-1770(-)
MGWERRQWLGDRGPPDALHRSGAAGRAGQLHGRGDGVVDIGRPRLAPQLHLRGPGPAADGGALPPGGPSPRRAQPGDGRLGLQGRDDVLPRQPRRPRPGRCVLGVGVLLSHRLLRGGLRAGGVLHGEEAGGRVPREVRRGRPRGDVALARVLPYAAEQEPHRPVHGARLVLPEEGLRGPRRALPGLRMASRVQRGLERVLRREAGRREVVPGARGEPPYGDLSRPGGEGAEELGG